MLVTSLLLAVGAAGAAGASASDGAAFVTMEDVKEWSHRRLSEAAHEFETLGFQRYDSPLSWGGEVVYNVFVDRFANGDIRNDLKNVEQSQRDQLSVGDPYSVYTWRHGGDLQGVRNRLGYLRDLGVTVVWLSPVFECNSGLYHGYCTSDPTKVDPGFGSEKLLRQLVHEAHQHGIRVLLDIVVNHNAASGLRYWGAPSTEKVTKCTQAAELDYWTQGRNMTFLDRAGMIWGTVPKYLQFESFYVRCGSKGNMRRPSDIDMLKSSKKDRQDFEAFNIWPEYFQDDWFEYNTMDPTFTEVFTNLMNYWVAYADIDGFRVDAVAHVSADFSAYLSTKTRHYAAALGKKNFYLMGEVLLPQAYPELYVGKVDMAQHLPKKLAEVLDELEPLFSNLSDSYAGMTSIYPSPESAAYIRSLSSGQNKPSDWFNNTAWARGKDLFHGILNKQANLEDTWAMVENQDQHRLLALQGGSMGWDQWRLLAALGWSFTSYGAPVLLYGAELAFNGQCLNGPAGAGGGTPVFGRDITPGSDPANRILENCNYSAHEDRVNDGFKRQDMFEGGPLLLGSAVPSVQARARISGKMMESWGPHWCEEDLLDRSNPVFRTVKALGRIRRSCPALRTNNMLNANASQQEQFAYWKVADASSAAGPSPRALLVLITFAPTPSWAASRFEVPKEVGFEAGATLVDLLRPGRKVAISADGFLEIPELSEATQVAIFALESATVSDGIAPWLLCAGHDLPELSTPAECRDPGHQWGTWAVLGTWALIVFGVLLKNARSSIHLCLVSQASPPEAPANPTALPAGVQEGWPKHVFVAAIEHTIPERAVKVSAGGLGKVLDQMLKEHPPGRLSLVHPRVGGVNYGETDFFTKISVVVDGQNQDVEVHTIESTYEDIARTWFILDHPWFTALTKEAPYPYPMTKLSVLRFFSLWNQASAALMVALRPDVYHCMDYHAAMVPLYLPREKQIPTIIVLHNADYDGAVETDFINDVAWKSVAAHRRLSLIFNLEMPSIRKYVTFEGRFNMLWAGIAVLKEVQQGYGVCTVSGKYADELKRERTMFQGLPSVMPIDNAIESAASDAPKSVEDLQLTRAVGKRRLQEFCGLDRNPEAKILIFLGRWVKQKGVDHIALLAPRILQAHPDVQFVLAGPAGDPYGSYAQEMLAPLLAEFEGRIFMATTFFSIPKEVRAGAHFCLMPSVSEPFGYVDVEFGILGVPSLGCAIGGLGKMPGVYFRQQNSDSSEMLLAGFYAAMDHALNMPDADYWAMAHAGMSAEFPFSVWRENLHECYRTALAHFKSENEAEADAEGDAKVSFDVLEEERRRRPWRMPVMSGSKVLNQIQRMDVTDAGEFLTQPVSEERVREIMRDWMAANKNRATDAETLQSHIALAAQRLKEKSCVTQWLMRPSSLATCLLGSRCLRVHVFIALGYILSPPTSITLDAETLHWTIDGGVSKEIGFNFTLVSWLLQALGLAVGSLIWLYLSRQVPANLLMSASLFLNLIYFFAAQTLVGTGSFLIHVCNFAGGILGSARLLFLVWNFNEDFKGGFQVAAKRVALVETARSVVAYSMQATNALMVNGALLQTWIYILSSFCLGFLVALAPSCYSTYVLPSTNFFKDLLQHRVYLLLTSSLALDALCSYSSQQSVLWLKLDGWMVNEVGAVLFAEAGTLLVLLVVIFTSLHKMSVWGPWAMRDFTCVVPPGSIMRTIAFANLGHLHYRSWLFLVAVVLSIAVDVARYSAMWTAMLSTLANKWYALKGGFLAVFVISLCTAVSPFVVHQMGNVLCGVSPVYDSFQAEYPQLQRLSLETAALWSVLPLSGAAYLLQLCAARYFSFEVLTYKGHGHVMPGGHSAGEGFSTLRVSSSGVARKMRLGTSAASGLDKARSMEALV